MRKSVLLCLIYVLLALGISSQGKAAKPFIDKEKRFQVPLDVSKHAAILDLGTEAYINFAKEMEKSGQWIYGFFSEVPKDPDTGKFIANPDKGMIALARYFKGDIALIFLSWMPTENLTLKEKFDKLHDIIKSNNAEDGEVQEEGKIEERTIGGFPAMGFKLKVLGTDPGYSQYWLVRAEKFKRFFLLNLSSTYGYEIPYNGFAKVKDGIVFLKP